MTCKEETPPRTDWLVGMGGEFSLWGWIPSIDTWNAEMLKGYLLGRCVGSSSIGTVKRGHTWAVFFFSRCWLFFGFDIRKKSLANVRWQVNL